MQVNGIGSGFHLNSKIKEKDDDIVYSCVKIQAGYNSGLSSYVLNRIKSLQYANKLLVSRAVDADGTFSKIENTVKVVNETGKVEIKLDPERDNGFGTPVHDLRAGSVVKFDIEAGVEGEYKIKFIEPPVEAVAQQTTIQVTSSLDDGDTISVDVNGLNGSYTASGSTTAADAAAGLAHDINSDANDCTATANDNTITIVASTAGVATKIANITGKLGAANITVENVPGESYELVFDDSTDFSTIAVANGPIYVKDSAMNAMAEAPKEGADLRTGDDMKPLTRYIANEDAYAIDEMSIPVDETAKLTFFAKSSGSAMNKIEIAIAREADFSSGKSEVFQGIALNDLFETAPLEAKREIALIFKKDGKIESSYIVSLIPGSKDYRNKSNYVEDIINKYESLVFVKDNTALDAMPESRLFKADKGNNTIVTDKLPLKTSNGTDGTVNKGDIEKALGNVSDNTIFGNKEEVDIDIVIANEKARSASGKLALERADCIAFIGSKFEDVVGLPSAKIVENLIDDVLAGELNSGNTANSFCATFGNYKQQYDQMVA